MTLLEAPMKQRSKKEDLSTDYQRTHVTSAGRQKYEERGNVCKTRDVHFS